jgi:hypothetical protein
MDQYSAWVGEWSTKKNDVKWQKLPNLSGMASHDAFADCISTLRVMQKMAGLFDEATENADLIELDF